MKAVGELANPNLSALAVFKGKPSEHTPQAPRPSRSEITIQDTFVQCIRKDGDFPPEIP